MPAVLPSGLEAFVEHVVPILQTLRERYGLPRPANQYLTPSLATV
jgi:hypothetical protein